MIKKFENFNEAIDFSKYANKSDKELTDKFNKLEDEKDIPEDVEKWMDDMLEDEEDKKSEKEKPENFKKWIKDMHEEEKSKKSENPTVDDLIAKYNKDKDSDSAEKIYKAYTRNADANKLTDPYFTNSSTTPYTIGSSVNLSTSDTSSTSTPQMSDDEVAALIDDQIKARRKKREKKPKRTNKLPKLKNHLIIKDDINEFYFVDDDVKTICSASGIISETFKTFKTDEDGRIIATCKKCKNKGLLLEHISEIKYIDLNK